MLQYELAAISCLDQMTKILLPHILMIVEELHIAQFLFFGFRDFFLDSILKPFNDDPQDLAEVRR